MPLPPAPTAPVSAVTRLRGIVLVVLGPVVFVGMSWVLVVMGPNMFSAGRPASTAQDVFGLGLLGGIAIAGAVFFVAGVHLLRSGTIPTGVKRIGLALVAVIVVCAVILSQSM